MKIEFTAKWELVIVAENTLESLALMAWSDRYHKDDKESDASLLIRLFKECNHNWLASTLPGVLCVCSNCGLKTLIENET